MATEQASIGTFDLCRVAAFGHAEQAQGLLIAGACGADRSFLPWPIGGLPLLLASLRHVQPFAPEQQQFTLVTADLAIDPGHTPAGAQQGFGLAALPTQQTSQAVTAGLATVEGGDGRTLPVAVQAQALHLGTRLLDMRRQYPPFALGQTPQEDKQQFILTRRCPTAQTLTQLRPGTQTQASVQDLPQQTTEQGTWNAGHGQPCRSTEHCDRPEHLGARPEQLFHLGQALMGAHIHPAAGIVLAADLAPGHGLTQ